MPHRFKIFLKRIPSHVKSWTVIQNGKLVFIRTLLTNKKITFCHNNLNISKLVYFWDRLSGQALLLRLVNSCLGSTNHYDPRNNFTQTLGNH